MSSVRIGRLAGIPIGVQPLWLLIVALITWTLGAVYYPDEVDGIAPAAAYALGLLSALLLFASILLHELGHALVARRHGVEIEEIDLWLLGGVARMAGHPQTAGAELRFALAGPAVTLAIAALFVAIDLLLPASAPAALVAVVAYQAFVNLAILIFNLLPAFPLDGGRVARALLWGRLGDVERATGIAAAVGRGFGLLMIGGGVFAALSGAGGGLWLAAVGVFVILAAGAEQRGLRIRVAFTGREAGRLMTAPAISIPAETSVERAIEDYLVRHRHPAFPVTEGGRAIGLIDQVAIERVPAANRAATAVGAVAVRDPDLLIDERQDVAELLERPRLPPPRPRCRGVARRTARNRLDHRRRTGAAGARPGGAVETTPWQRFSSHSETNLCRAQSSRSTEISKIARKASPGGRMRRSEPPVSRALVGAVIGSIATASVSPGA